jgi:alpha-N-acetylglucosamine transferase
MNITITSIVISVIAILILRFATSILLKILGFLAIAGLVIFLMFHFGVGPFKQNPISIQTMEEKYCGQALQKNKCDCIVQNIVDDLHERWSNEELAESENNRTRMAYMVKKSFEAKKQDIVSCLAKRGAEAELKEFTKDLFPIQNDFLNKIGDIKDNVTEKTKGLLDSLTKKKDSIDERY